MRGSGFFRMEMTVMESSSLLLLLLRRPPPPTPTPRHRTKRGEGWQSVGVGFLSPSGGGGVSVLKNTGK